jgi:hypothetical protein
MFCISADVFFTRFFMSNRRRGAFLTISFIILWITIVGGQDGIWLGYAMASFYLLGTVLYSILEENGYSVCASRNFED